jgi:murein DD-endopeptidase MepM/ murein hydrolase activator NlpD
MICEAADVSLEVEGSSKLNLRRCIHLTLALILAGCSVDFGEPEPDSSDPPVALPGLGARLSVAPIGPLVPARAEGQLHLLYELRVVGFDPRTLRIDSVGVYSGDSVNTLLTTHGTVQLADMVESFAPGDGLSIESGRESVLFFTIAIPSEIEVRHLIHRLWLSSESRGATSSFVLNTEPIAVETGQGPLVDPPLRGGPWLAHAGPGGQTHHRRTLAPRDGKLTMDQRFATDWFRLALDPETDAEILGPDWVNTAGEPVFAVANGVVVAVVDGLPDEPIGELGASGLVIDWETISGNRVVIDIGDGHYAWYEHLESGSVVTQVGARVTRGQVIGRVGNSGNTSHPHLHFAVTDSPIVGQGRGLPYRFRCFEWFSRIAPIPSWDQVAEDDPADFGLAGTAFVPGQAELRRSEIPLGGAIVDFSDAVIAGCPAGGGASGSDGSDRAELSGE